MIPMSRTRRLLWAAVVLALALVIGTAWFAWWGNHPLQPSPAALAALSTDTSVTVTQADGAWEFKPSGVEPSSAVIFYPGGHVDARSYAPYARDVAAKGYLVAIPAMPLSLAVLSPNAADKIISAHPAITRWVMAGHSLGGAMAASYAAKHVQKVSGLVLLAAYSAGGDLKTSEIPVVSLVGSLDSVINRKRLEDGKRLLPDETQYITLEGGNHAQFGDYGPQPGDNPNPTMPADVQRREAVDNTVAVLRRSAANR